MFKMPCQHLPNVIVTNRANWSILKDVWTQIEEKKNIGCKLDFSVKYRGQHKGFSD